MTKMISLIRAEIFGAPCDISANDMRDGELEKIYALSKSHDLAHIVSSALSKRGLLCEGEVAEKFKKQQMLAVFRTEGMMYELERLCSALDGAGIPYMLLKGSILRKRYPEPWMRTSSDIDILVHKDDLERAADTICEGLQYNRKGKGAYDISMHSPGGVHVELHYDLMEERRFAEACTVLERVWENAVQAEGTCRYMMSDEMFYFYHIIHMAKHFEDGGCGIRPFIDLCMIGNENEEKTKEFLVYAGLDKFERVAKNLAGYWFFCEDADELTLQMQEYILSGGVYGTGANRIAVHRQKSGGALRYALSKIFLPYEILKYQYPIIQKHPVLTPVMEVRRWFKLIFCGHLKRTTTELLYNQNIDSADAENTKRFLLDIGLIK